MKSFPNVLALDNVDFELYPNEVHALLGENGAGKTTLMNILYGIYKADRGKIVIRGREVKMRSSLDAQKNAIGMVHQHFSLIPVFTVKENLMIGLTDRGFRLNVGQVEEKIKNAEEKYGINIDLDKKIEQLSMGERQRVEILKLLFRGADTLILDEPTSVLTPQEVTNLFKSLRALQAEGKNIVIITHKLYEAIDLADRVTVLWKGKVVFKSLRKGLAVEMLTEAMIGREVDLVNYVRKEISSENMLKIANLTVKGDTNEIAVNGVSFELHQGEVLGIAGVSGNGQRELIEALFSLRKTQSGEMTLNGKPVTKLGVKAKIKEGLGYIPEERRTRGIAADLPLTLNSIMHDHWGSPYLEHHMLNYVAIKKFTDEVISSFNVVTKGDESMARELSGGNIQKFIVGREMTRRSEYLMAVNPTAGLDMGATEHVRNALMEFRNEGKGVLLISDDLDEMLALCDRIVVMFRGRISAPLGRDSFDKFKIGAMMLGEEFAKVPASA